jgi:hypothetical protein
MRRGTNRIDRVSDRRGLFHLPHSAILPGHGRNGLIGLQLSVLSQLWAFRATFKISKKADGYSIMKATYRISEEDYVNAMRLFAKLTPRLVIIYLASALALVALAVFGTQVLRGGAIGGLIGGLSVTLIGRYIVSPILARKHYRKYKAIHDEFAVELVEDGVRFTSPNADGKITWDKMLKWRQNEKYVLIYPMPRIYHIVPKSVATQGFDLQALTNELLLHVGEPT